MPEAETALKVHGRIAQELDRAEQNRQSLGSFTAAGIALSVAEAYAVQEELVRHRLKRGEARLGFKLGFTSKSKMAQMGVSEVIVGQLTQSMRISEGGTVDLSRFIQPKIEPEVAFLLDDSVDFADSAADIRSSVIAIAPAMEIIDSRYLNYKFSYTDVIADNTSAAGYVLGAWQEPARLDNRAVRFQVNSDVESAEESGNTAAILCDPWRSLDELLRTSQKYRLPLAGHQIVLAGAATAALPFDAAAGSAVTARCEISGLGVVTVKGVRGNDD